MLAEYLLFISQINDYTNYSIDTNYMKRGDYDVVKRNVISDKVLILGLDGLDARLLRKYVGEGKLPNFKKYIERGAQREDLVLLGAQPTVTPAQWTTLGTGAYPCTHGVTDFFAPAEDLDGQAYNFDSRNCAAEPIWNCFAESDKKTLVFHWPGSACRQPVIIQIYMW